MSVANIFSPKPAFEKNKDGKFVKVDHITPGQKDFDEYYIDYEVVSYPVPVEGGEPDEYVLKQKIKVTKRSIREVIESQADDVGLDAALRKYAITGDPSVLPSSVQASDEVLDLTALPEDSADYFQYIHGLAAAYDALPIDLRRDMDMQTFTSKVINGEIDVNSYLSGVKAQFEASHEAAKDNKKEGE